MSNVAFIFFSVTYIYHFSYLEAYIIILIFVVVYNYFMQTRPLIQPFLTLRKPHSALSSNFSSSVRRNSSWTLLIESKKKTVKHFILRSRKNQARRFHGFDLLMGLIPSLRRSIG